MREICTYGSVRGREVTRVPTATEGVHHALGSGGVASRFRALRRNAINATMLKPADCMSSATEIFDCGTFLVAPCSLGHTS